MQGEILSLPGKKKLNVQALLSDAILVRRDPFALLSREDQVSSGCQGGSHCLRDLYLVVAVAPQDQDNSMVYCVGNVGLPLASPFTDALSGACKQDKY